MGKALKDLSLGYLCSRTIGEMHKELASMQPMGLDYPADPYLAGFRRNAGGSIYSSPLQVLSVYDTARVLKAMKPAYGKPTTYEVKKNFGKIGKRQHYSSDGYIESAARIVQWQMTTLGQALQATYMLENNLKVAFYVSNKNSISIYCPEDCFVPVLLKSDDPNVWAAENQRKWESLQKRRRIQTVVDKLDRVK